jgi:cellulose synthase/poly-beta-1,6-N-acetylglucosamine synthase-like glycosyltransferase
MMLQHEDKISVLIPLKKLNAYVRECLDGLRAQTYRNFDVYVVTDEPESLEDLGELDVHFMASGPVPPNIKRMMAAQASDAAIVALIDDDAYPVPEWLASAVRHFSARDVVGVGGPGVTPPQDDASQQVSGAVYASALVSAGYTYRYIPGAERDVDDYPSCNLILRRDLFLKHVPSCLRYWPGEDTKLCMLLTNDEGMRIVYDPRAAVFHHRRRLFWGHFRQIWNYAVHRGFFAKRYPETSRRAAYFVPTVFAFANLVFFVLLGWPPARAPLIAIATVYLVLLAGSSVASMRAHRANPVMVALGIYLTHLAYGVGFLLGLLRPELEH